VTTMAAIPPRRPGGLLPWIAWIAWILDDEGRTRRLCSVLYLVAPVLVILVLALAVVIVFFPLAGAAIGGLSWPAVVVVRRLRRPTN
jgi:hypothetical protein